MSPAETIMSQVTDLSKLTWAQALVVIDERVKLAFRTKFREAVLGMVGFANAAADGFDQLGDRLDAYVALIDATPIDQPLPSIDDVRTDAPSETACGAPVTPNP